MNRGNSLIVLTMFYMTIKITTALMIYKIFNIYGINISASTLIIPLWFLTGDVIAEIYGFRVARNALYIAVAFQFVFALICWVSVNIPSAPNILDNQLAYKEILGGLPRVALASCFGIMVGGLFNAYILNKWRILLDGKYFGIRSIGASSLGELIFTVCVYTIEFIGKINNHNIFQLLIVSYLLKLCVNLALIVPIGIIAQYLKKIISTETLLSEINVLNFGAQFVELYTGSDGKSYFRDIIVDTPIKQPLGLYSEKIKVSNLQFRDFSANVIFDWHVAPQRQYIIYQNGTVQVEASGGETRRFRSGDILLANDIAGKGHITTTITDGKSIIITTT